MRCEVCGNEYEACFTVQMERDTYVFDCFECAIHALASVCVLCGCKIVGHGLAADGETFCCEHCLRMVRGAADEESADDEDAIDLEWDDDDVDDDDVDDDDGDDYGRRRCGRGGRRRGDAPARAAALARPTQQEEEPNP